jgi:hypothetical protein
MASITFGSSTGSWLTDADWVGGSKPTAADDVFFDGTSGSCTIGNGAVCRSINCTGYTNTITHSSSSSLTIGDGTAGASNIALKFVAGMTYTASATTSTITFVSTSATVQTVDFAGKSTGNVTFNASSNGSWQYTGTQAAISTSVSLTLTKGTLDTNGQTITVGKFNSSNSNVRTLTMGASSITLTNGGGFGIWDTTTVTNLTITANTATVTLSGSGSPDFTSATKDFNGLSLVITGNINNNSLGGFPIASASLTFANVTCTGTAAKVGYFPLNGNITCTGTFTCNGNSAVNRLWVRTYNASVQRTITAATVSVTNSDFMDIVGAGAGSWDLSAITGNSGDCGGNSGITFTTAAAQTATGTSGFTWSTHGWTSRVPLPQDDVTVNNSFTSGQQIFIDMPRMGKSIDFSGMSWSGTATMIVFSATFQDFFGSYTLKSGITYDQGSVLLTARGRGSYTFTSAGLTGGSGGFTLDAPTGTITLQDAFSLGSVGTFTITRGTFDANNYSVTMAAFSGSNSNTRTITMGSGTWSVRAGAWTMTTITGLTFNSNTSTIALTQTSSTNRTFAGGGLTYNNLTITGSGTGAWTFTGSNTFNVFTIGAPKTIYFTAGTTTTVQSFVATGTAGNLITISSATAATHTISDTSGTNTCDYLSLSYSIASGASSVWYAGSHSTNGGNNTGWIFSDPNTGSNTSNFFLIF